MRDESAVCRVASRVVVAAWSGSRQGRETPATRRPALERATPELARFDSSFIVSRELEGRKIPAGILCPRASSARAAGTLPFELVDLALDLQADLLWVSSRLDGWLSVLEELRSVGAMEPMAGLVRARTGVEPDDALPPSLPTRDRDAVLLWASLLPRVRFASQAGSHCVYLKLGMVREFGTGAWEPEGLSLERLAVHANRHGFLIAVANRAILPLAAEEVRADPAFGASRPGRWRFACRNASPGSRGCSRAWCPMRMAASGWRSTSPRWWRLRTALRMSG